MDNTRQEKKDKKLTLTVRNVETLEVRAAPNTACPTDQFGDGCCKSSRLQAAKLTAVAYF